MVIDYFDRELCIGISMAISLMNSVSEMEAERFFVELTGTDLERMRRILRHSLRNAASGIKAASSLLGSELDERLKPREREYFPLIERECDRICDITERIEDFFTVSVDEKCSPLGHGIKSTLAVLHITHPMMEVRCTETAMVSQRMVPESTVRVVLCELLRNAYEASFKSVDLCIYESHEECRFRIIDQGAGLSVDEAALAKKPFYTTRSRALGLGLPIAERHLSHYGECVTFGREERGHFVEFSLPV